MTKAYDEVGMNISSTLAVLESNVYLRERTARNDDIRAVTINELMQMQSYLRSATVHSIYIQKHSMQQIF